MFCTVDSVKKGLSRPTRHLRHSTMGPVTPNDFRERHCGQQSWAIIINQPAFGSPNLVLGVGFVPVTLSRHYFRFHQDPLVPPAWVQLLPMTSVRNTVGNNHQSTGVWKSKSRVRRGFCSADSVETGLSRPPRRLPPYSMGPVAPNDFSERHCGQ